MKTIIGGNDHKPRCGSTILATAVMHNNNTLCGLKMVLQKQRCAWPVEWQYANVSTRKITGKQGMGQGLRNVLANTRSESGLTILQGGTC